MDISTQLVVGKRTDGLTLMSAQWLLAYRDESYRLVPNGEFVIERGEVIYTGPPFEGDVARRINFGNALISPGLIDLDAQSDLDTYLLVTDNQPSWAKGRIWPRSNVSAASRDV